MDRKYILDTEENKAFLKETRETLWNFGVHFAAPGGSSYYLGDDGTPWKDRPRETYVTSRMCHVYSIGKILGFKKGEALAKKALKGLKGELKDKNNGGWYAGLNEDGSPLPDKLCYAHAFVILAATSAINSDIKGGGELLEEALKVYDERFWNEEEGKSSDFWDTDFKVMDPYRGANANMHTVEAFLAVADTLNNDEYRIRAGRIIDFISDCARKNSWRIPEHFTDKWEIDNDKNIDKPDDPFKPYGATPGHGLEWARLISQWALSTYGNTDKAKPYIEISENLFNRAVSDAWNADGNPGICYTTDWEGKPVVHDRMHWTLCEAIDSAAVLYRITGKQEYADRYAEFWEYADKYVIDHKNGSFFHQLDRNNEVMTTVWPGKADIYHALQATLIPYASPDTSICKAILQ